MAKKLIRLNPGHRFFHAPDCGVKVDMYTPDAFVEEITPHLQEGLDALIISIVPDVETQVVDEVSIPLEDAAPVVDVKVEEQPEAPQAEESAEEPAEEPAAEEPVVEKRVRPNSDDLCSCTTSSGKKCKKKALKYSDKCVFHISEEELAEVDKQLDAEGAE